MSTRRWAIGSAAIVLGMVSLPVAADGATPPAPQCDVARLAGTDPVGGPFVYVPAGGVEGGSPVHNTTSSAIRDDMSVEVLAPPQLTGRALRPPTVSWSIDGGRWRRIALTSYRPESTAGPARWSSDHLPAPPLAAHSTHLFRVWIAFHLELSPGDYIVRFRFRSAACTDDGASGGIAVAYRPDRIAALTAPTPARLVASAAGGVHGYAIRRTVGWLIAGIIVLLAMRQAIRWRRERRP